MCGGIMMTPGTGARGRKQYGKDASAAKRRRTPASLLIATASFFALAITACETDEPPRRELRTPAAEAPSPLPGPETPHTPIVVTLSEWEIFLEPHEPRAGRHEFLVVNDGLYPHAFVVERGEERWETSPIPPGGQATLVTDLSEGTYTLYCPIEDEHGDHSEKGMRTTLDIGPE